MNTKFINRRSIYLLAAGAMIFQCLSCSKEHKSTEVKFPVYFISKEKFKKKADSTKVTNSYNSVRASGRALLPVQPIDSVSSFTELPLNVGADSSVFIFSNELRSDTMVLKYQRKLATEERDLVMKITRVKMSSSTFDSIKVNCKSPNTDCNDTESVIIYY